MCWQCCRALVSPRWYSATKQEQKMPPKWSSGRACGAASTTQRSQTTSKNFVRFQQQKSAKVVPKTKPNQRNDAGTVPRQSMRTTLQRTRSELSTLCHRHEVFNSLLTRCNVARIFCHDLSPAGHCTRRRLIPEPLKIQRWTCNLVTIEMPLQSLGNSYIGQSHHTV